MFDNYLRLHSYKCPKCNNNVIVDDVDYNFKGNEDDYCYCDTCKIGVFIKVRFGKICKVEFSKDEKDFIFDVYKKDFFEKR